MDRGRINFWLVDKQHDWWCERSGRMAEVAGWIQVTLIEVPARWLLCRLFGHKPIPDQCNKPEHDYCVYCDKRTPGKASRQVVAP